MSRTIFTFGWLVVWLFNKAPHTKNFPFLKRDWLIALVVCIIIDILVH